MLSVPKISIVVLSVQKKVLQCYLCQKKECCSVICAKTEGCSVTDLDFVVQCYAAFILSKAVLMMIQEFG